MPRQLPFGPSGWRRHTAAAALALVLAAPMASAQPTAPPAEAATPATDRASADLLRRRYDIAIREQEQARRRLAEMREDVEALRDYVEDSVFSRLMRPAEELPVSPPPLDPSRLEGDALQGTTEEAEQTARDLAARVLLMRTALRAYGEEIERGRYQRLVDEVAGQVAELRGLPLKNRVKSIVLDREALAALLDKLLEEELPPEKVRGESLTWQALGLMPPGTDLKLLYRDLLEEQVGGLYNEKDSSLYVVDTFNPRSIIGRVILAHEICHAIQDQNFPIKSLPFRTENNDQNMAVSAVLEGDATVLMIEWAAGNFRPGDLLGLTDVFKQGTQQLETVPPALVQAMVFPYMVGAEFMTLMQTTGAEDWRNKPFRDPPQSTEQILHFDKYYPVKDPPIEVHLPAWEETGEFEEVYRGVVGEWITRLILARPQDFPEIKPMSTSVYVTERVAVEGAAGWGGDHIVTVASPDDTQWFVAWKKVWDRASDGEEFETAFARRVVLWEGFSSERAEHGLGRDRSTRTWHGAGGRIVRLERSAQETLLLIATDADVLATAEEWAKETEN